MDWSAKSAEGSILYRPTNQFGLGYIHLADLHERAQVSKWHMMKYSNDPNARGVYEYLLDRDQKGHIGTGRKSTPRLQLEATERALSLDDMLSNASV